MNKRVFWILLFIILIAAAAPRMIELLNHNYLFGYDQGEYYENVRKMFVEHKATLIGIKVGGMGGFFQGPGWLYLLAIPFWLMHGDPYGGMILMFLISMVSIFTAIWWVSKKFDAVTGLLVGLTLTLSPALVSQARFIWPPFPVTLLTVIFLYCMFQVFSKKSTYFVGAVLSLTAIMNFEMATFGTWFAANIPLFVYLFVKKLIKIKDVLLSVLGGLIIFSPLIIFDLRHNFISLKGMINIFANPSTEHKVTWLYRRIMYINHWAIFNGNFSSTFNWPLKFSLVFFIILILVSIPYLLDKNNSQSKKHFLLYLIITPFLLFTIFLFYTWPMWEWWILQLIVIYCFWFGILCGYYWQKHIIGKIIVIALMLMSFWVYLNRTIFFYKYDYPDYGGTHKIKGVVDAIGRIYQDAGGKPFNLLSFTPPVYTYAFDYVAWWYGTGHYGYVPGNKKEGTFYLLMEPDPSKPYSYNGWLETVIKTGTIIKTDTLPSGFIIQKRQAE